MESERLKIFDQHHHPIGVATRAEIHKKGLWHETFHCWLISKIDDEYYLYFQLRSALKKDYPSLFDITAAGHLLATESPDDGIRELQEELGLPLSKESLEKLAIVPSVIEQSSMIDREFAHVYLVIQSGDFKGFDLQLEEVAGIVRAKLMDAIDFFEGQTSELHLEGFEIIENGERQSLVRNAKPNDFVRYDGEYMEELVILLKEKFNF